MTRTKTETSIKLVNHLTANGKKLKGEKIVMQTLKTLQKTLKKPATRLILLALTRGTPVFKINTSTQKKRKKKKQIKKIFPAFISNKKTRASFAVKFIVKAALKEKGQPFFQKLLSEIYTASQARGPAIDSKKETQKQALSNRRLFRYYRWH